MDYQTPLARARGFGSAKEGSHHWWHQRITAVALLPLSFWVAFSVAALPDASYEDVVIWISDPWNFILLLSFVGVGSFHAVLGVQTIIEDYVHTDWLKILMIVSVKMILPFLAAVAAFATLRVVFA